MYTHVSSQKENCYSPTIYFIFLKPQGSPVKTHGDEPRAKPPLALLEGEEAGMGAAPASEVFACSCILRGGGGVPDTRMHALTWKMARRSLLLSIVRGAFPVGLHWQAHMEGALFICSSLAAEGCSRRAGGPRLYSCGGGSLGGEGAAGLLGGGSAGAGAGAFQWQHRGAGDRLIKVLTDGLCYGTYVCAWPHDSHLSQLAAREGDADLVQEQWGEEGPGAVFCRVAHRACRSYGELSWMNMALWGQASKVPGSLRECSAHAMGWAEMWGHQSHMCSALVLHWAVKEKHWLPVIQTESSNKPLKRIK